MSENLSDLIKAIDPCTCDAQYSGRDDPEYRARGCPSCICEGPRLKAIALELSEAIERYNTEDEVSSRFKDCFKYNWTLRPSIQYGFRTLQNQNGDIVFGFNSITDAIKKCKEILK